MNKHETKTWHRLVALVLSFIMVLGMLPANPVSAEEAPDATPAAETTLPIGGDGDFDAPEGDDPVSVLTGKVSAITAGGTVTGSTVAYNGATLDWTEAGWQIGIQVDAPEGMTLDQLKAATYNDGTEAKNFWENQTSEKTEDENAPHHIALWASVTEAALQAALANETDKTLTYTWAFDWNNDGTAEQTVQIVLDATNVVLNKDGEQVFPVPEYAVTFNHGEGSFLAEGGTKLANGQFKKGTELKFTYAVNAGFGLTAVKCNGTALTADASGVYTVTITGETTIAAETKDTKLPDIGSVKVSDADQWTTAKTISFTVSDNVGVKTVYISTDSDYTNVASRKELTSSNGNYSHEVRKIGTYYIHAFDEAGNRSFYSQEVTHIDITGAELGELKKPALYKKTWSIEVTDNESGIVECWYSTNESGEPAQGKQTFDSPVSSNKYTFKANRNGTYYIFVKNAAGIITSTAQKLNDYDELAPVIGITPDKTWSNVSNTVKVTVDDDQTEDTVVSGLAAVYYSAASFSTEEVAAMYAAGTLADNGFTLLGNSKGEYSFTVTANGTYYVWALDSVLSEDEITPMPNVACEAVVVDHIDKDASVVESVNASTSDWTIFDVIITGNVSDSQSGVKAVYYSTVENDTNPSKAKLNNGKYEFAVPANQNFDGNYYVWSEDNVGNIGEAKTVAVKTINTKPENPSAVIKNGTEAVEGEFWFNQQPVVTVTAVTGWNNAPVVTEYRLWNTTTNEKTPDKWTKVDFAAEQTETDLVSLIPEENGAPVDGVYTLELRSRYAFDKDGYHAPDPAAYTIRVDSSDPTDLIIEYRYTETDENGDPVLVKEDLSNQNGDVTKFDHWYNEPITIYLDADFNISGMGKMEYLIVENVGAYTALETPVWTAYPESGIEITPNEKFVLYFRAEDAAGNHTIIHSTGIIVDDQAPEGGEFTGEMNAKVTFDYPDPNGENDFYTDPNGFDINVSLIDPEVLGNQLTENKAMSGLKSISYKLTTVKNSKEPNAQGGDLMVVAGAVTSSQEVSRVDDLIAQWVATVHVDPKLYDGNTICLEITAVDNAGNSKTFTTGEMKIDITKPTATVSFEPELGDNGSKYFNVTRTATVEVTERNFDAARTNVTITATLDDKAITIPVVQFVSNGDLHTATIPFVNDGDYTLAVDVTDLAGNAITNDEVTYESQHSDAFTIDKTQPEITVSYDNNAASNGKYFNQHRLATVTVTERNFDAARTAAHITAQLNGQGIRVPTALFVSNGNQHVAKIHYDRDGDYTFSVEATDLAGNVNAPVDFGNSVAHSEFTVDTTIKEPTVGGVENGGAYKDEVAPSVTVHDVNYEDYTLTLTRTNMQDKNKDVTEQFMNLIQFTTPGGTLRTEDIPHLAENDGIYTLTVTIYDKAGNSTTTVTTFTVNRFGSVYVPGDYLRDKVMNGFIHTIDQDLTLTEYNPDKLTEGSIRIEITRDGKPLDIAEDLLPTPVPNDSVLPGASGWFEYLYTFSKDLFTEDGVYKITLLSKDNTGNESQSEIITFRVDKTAPELSSVVGLEDRIINAQEVEVRYTAFDAIGLESITIYINGNEVPYAVITDFGDDFNNYSDIFKLTESNDVQTVRIVIRDLAGNILDTDSETFASAYKFNRAVTVSTNWFVRWFANKPLFFGSLAGIGGGLWLLWFLIFGKRKKEEEEEQSV